MKKRATTQWTMSKLLTMILAVFLLVLIIYGVQNKGFGPLRENIEGRFNEVLIFLGFRSDGLPTCGDAYPEKIDGDISGDFYPCDDNCSFVISNPKELLNFSRFTVDGRGYFVSKDKKRDDRVGYSFASVESKRHRVAYNLLSETIREFLEGGDAVDDLPGIGGGYYIEGDGWYNKDGARMGTLQIVDSPYSDDKWSITAHGYVVGWIDKDDNFKPADHSGITPDANRQKVIDIIAELGYVGKDKISLEGGNDGGINYEQFVDAMDFGSGMTLVFEVDDNFGNTFYEYNGENWRIGTFKNGQLKGSKISAKDVKDKLWDVYYRHDITWNYKGDGKKNIVLTDFNKNFKNLEASRSDFFMWFEGIKEKSKGGDKITIEIADAGFHTRYFLEKGKWEEYNALWWDSSISEKDVYDAVYKDHKGKYEIVWYYDDGVKKTIVSDEKVKSRDSTDEGKFNGWFDKLQNNWSSSKKNQDYVLRELRGYEYKDVVFEGGSYEVKNGFAHSVFKIPMIYFDSSEGERFGVYYEDKKPVLYYKGDDSLVSDFVGISNEDWEEFLKINKIYEYFKLRRCVK